MGWFRLLTEPQITPPPHRTVLKVAGRRVRFTCHCGATGPAYRDDDYGRSRARYAAIWHPNLNTKEQEQ